MTLLLLPTLFRALRRRGLFRFAAALAAMFAVCIGARAQKQPLNGTWQFVTDPSAKLGVSDIAAAPGTRPVQVPGSWQTEFADLRDYAGVAWYWRTCSTPQLTPGRTAIIRFGAVDYRATVYVNGQKAGDHDGGYLPFEFDVTSLLHAGENQLAVRVVDPSAKLPEVEGIRYAEIPHGKQNWYVETSGLWQGVDLVV